MNIWNTITKYTSMITPEYWTIDPKESVMQKLKEREIPVIGDEDPKACIVCYTYQVDLLFKPCLHAVMCLHCFMKQESATCVFCRQEITDVMVAPKKILLFRWDIITNHKNIQQITTMTDNL